MTHKVAVVGNTSFDPPMPIKAEIAEMLRSYGEDVVFLTRGPSGELERFVAAVAITLGRRCFAYPGKGGSDNFARDQELVDDCDELVAFFDPASLDQGAKSGTARVVALAQTAGKPVKAASVAGQELVWVGR